MVPINESIVPSVEEYASQAVNGVNCSFIVVGLANSGKSYVLKGVFGLIVVPVMWRYNDATLYSQCVHCGLTFHGKLYNVV